MIGRQVIVTNRAFTMEELLDFMKQNWDTEKYGTFFYGKPTRMSAMKYIVLPATPRYVTIIHTAKAGGLFAKDNKVILSTADSESGAIEGLYRASPGRDILTGALKITSGMSAEKERKGPAEDILLEYTEHMRELLHREGYTK